MATATYTTADEPHGFEYDVPVGDHLYLDANGSNDGIHYVQNVGQVPIVFATNIQGWSVANTFKGITLMPGTVMKLIGVYDLYFRVADGDWPVDGKIMAMGSQYQ